MFELNIKIVPRKVGHLPHISLIRSLKWFVAATASNTSIFFRAHMKNQGKNLPVSMTRFMFTCCTKRQSLLCLKRRQYFSIYLVNNAPSIERMSAQETAQFFTNVCQYLSTKAHNCLLWHLFQMRVLLLHSTRQISRTLTKSIMLFYKQNTFIIVNLYNDYLVTPQNQNCFIVC